MSVLGRDGSGGTSRAHLGHPWDLGELCRSCNSLRVQGLISAPPSFSGLPLLSDSWALCPWAQSSLERSGEGVWLCCRLAVAGRGTEGHHYWFQAAHFVRGAGHMPSHLGSFQSPLFWVLSPWWMWDTAGSHMREDWRGTQDSSLPSDHIASASAWWAPSHRRPTSAASFWQGGTRMGRFPIDPNSNVPHSTSGQWAI